MRQLLPLAAANGAYTVCPGILASSWAPGTVRRWSLDRPEFSPAQGRLGRLARARGMGRLGGLGTGETGQLALSAGSVAATGGLSIGAAALAGASLTLPIVGVAIAGVALAITAILHSGCGQTCVITSNWANQAEALLAKNVHAYFDIPSPRPRAAQVAALANFDSVWNYLQQQCGSPQVGDAGKACIEDRQAGACKWKQTSTSTLLSIPGEPQPGACWNWFSGYRDPIANDTSVVDTPQSAQAEAALGSDPVATLASHISSGVDSVGASLGMSGGTLLLLGGALLLAFGLGGK